MSEFDIPDFPIGTLTNRYIDPMDGCESKVAARLSMLHHRPGNALVVPFQEEESRRHSPKVSVAESVLYGAKDGGATILLLLHSGTGTAYEYSIDSFNEKPYEEKHGEERYQHERGLYGAKYRWVSVGSDLFTNKSFLYP